MKSSFYLLPCIALGLGACNAKRGAAAPGISTQAQEEEARVLRAKLQEELDLMKKAAAESLPEGWAMTPTDQFDLSQNPSNDRVEKSAEVTEITFSYSADPTTQMVEEGARETGFARQSFQAVLLFPERQRAGVPANLNYPGKTPPPTIEALMVGKTFVQVHRGNMRFETRVEIKRTAGVADCRVIEGPRPLGLQPTNVRIYPLTKAKPGTYCHGALISSMGLDRSQLLETLVSEAVEKRQAELVADGVDREQERNRIAALYNRVE
ncbi:MAG: hypothetical protein V4584_10910 [Verrucomicrobiota bacterium]